MARGTTEKRRLIKFSNYSMCVTLPKWVIDQLGWEKGDVLTLTSDVKQGKITLFKDGKENRPAEKRVISEEPMPVTDSDLTQATEITGDEPQKLRW